jgi:hypothetical protein
MANSKRVETFPPERLRTLLGPAETQYGPPQALTLALRGGAGALACGSTVVDQSPQDGSSSAGDVAVLLVWNDLLGATRYRVQIDEDSATFVTEDDFAELPPDATALPVGDSESGTHTLRILAHIGHAPNHGGTPIAGDILSNDCTVTFSVPSP